MNLVMVKDKCKNSNMKKLYTIYLVIAGSLSAFVLVPRVLQISDPKELLYTGLGILTATVLFLVVLKSAAKKKSD